MGISMAGRPTTYTEELATRILEEVAGGKSLREVCKSDEYPSRSTVNLWVLKGSGGDDVYAKFSAQYAQAQAIRAYDLFDELFEIADDASNDWMVRTNKDGSEGYQLNGEHVQRSRLRVDTRKWALSKMIPKEFADKVQQDHTSSDGSMTPKSPSDISPDMVSSLVSKLTD